jgi:hypothetical protein
MLFLINKKRSGKKNYYALFGDLRKKNYLAWKYVRKQDY